MHHNLRVDVAHSSCQVCPFLLPGLPIPLAKFAHFSFLVCQFLLASLSISLSWFAYSSCQVAHLSCQVCLIFLPRSSCQVCPSLLPGLPIPIARFAHSSCQVCLFLLPGLPIPLACSLWTEYNGFDQVEGANSTAPRNGVKMN